MSTQRSSWSGVAFSAHSKCTWRDIRDNYMLNNCSLCSSMFCSLSWHLLSCNRTHSSMSSVSILYATWTDCLKLQSRCVHHWLMSNVSCSALLHRGDVFKDLLLSVTPIETVYASLQLYSQTPCEPFVFLNFHTWILKVINRTTFQFDSC